MDDEQILARGGDEYEIAEYAKEHGATDPTNPILKAHLEGVEQMPSKVYDVLAMWYNNSDKTPESLYAIVKSNMESFFTTYGTNLLKAALEAGAKDSDSFMLGGKLHYRTSFRSAIDEGIKEITKL